MADWKEEVSRLNIAEVAERLGIQLKPGRRLPREGLCPFHDDTSPSLNLYGGPDPHFHCFVCQAHGDTVELVKRRRKLDFPEALEWLRSNFGVPTEISKARRTAAGGNILTRALEFWRTQPDHGLFDAFTAERGFTSAALKSAGMIVGSPEAFLRSLRGDRAAEDSAVVAGLAFPQAEAERSLVEASSPAPFARGDQLIIPIMSAHGRVEGLMARALVGGRGPKYRFTTGFRKSSVLYGADRVQREISRNGRTAFFDDRADRFDLFVCEGVFDALRLDSLGIPAVATLGSAISDVQLEVLSDFAKQALDTDCILRVHLFFDIDKPGRRAMADALPRLMAKAYRSGFLIDVVGLDPENDTSKEDPDTVLRDATKERARSILSEGLRAPLEALAAIALDSRFTDTTTVVESLDAAGSIVLQNKLARRLKGLDWPKVWRKLAPNRTTTSIASINQQSQLSATFEDLTSDLERADRFDLANALPDPLRAVERDTDANLLHALILAREATDSREYPVDVAAWDRLEGGAQVFLPLIRHRLATPGAPIQPYFAHYEQKESGAPRLKCGPCPEDAIQQQYVLSELLRIRPGRKDLAARIPAVRYWADRPDLVVTGEDAPQAAVSFAYQVDMRALEERPDRSRRRDMFRPFLDCWNSFIGHVGRRFDRMTDSLIYVARLDIAGFYDNIPRSAVRTALIKAIPESDTLDTAGIAMLFHVQPGEDRRHALINWLLTHSFGDVDRGYQYFNPATGEPFFKGGAKGLPQGPSLSSYLANIVLFPLDAVMEKLVYDLDEAAAMETERGRSCGAVYARYVDDIIIAARNPEDLRDLRTAVEAQLCSLGLRLNHKSEHLDAMSPNEARNWVVERRGAGFVAYGDVDDLPNPVPDVRTSWSDIPTLDRRMALNLIYWTALDDPTQTDETEFSDTLSALARATDLRPTDLGHIARRITLRASLEVTDKPEPDRLRAFLGRYKELWQLVGMDDDEPRPLAQQSGHDSGVVGALHGARYFLATIAGIEKLVLGRPEENPTFSLEVRGRIRAAKADIFGWVLNNNLLQSLRAELIPSDFSETVAKGLASQIDIAIAILEERAARVVRLDRKRFNIKILPRPSHTAPTLRPSTKSIRLGWQRTFCPEGLQNTDAENQPLRLFHAIAAEIQAAGGMSSTVSEAGQPTRQEIDHAMLKLAQEALTLLENADAKDDAMDIARAFKAMAGANDNLSPTALSRAVSAFLTLCIGPGQIQAFIARPCLAKAVAGEGETILPLPPISGQPGFFTFNDKSRRVRAVRIETAEEGVALLPDELTWEQQDSINGFQAWEAILPPGHGFLLDPISKVRAIDDRLDTIADVFDGILANHGAVGGEYVPLVHVFSLVGPLDSLVRQSQNACWIVIAWRISPESCEQLVFERRGDGVAVERSPHAGAQLWRIGQSVADLFAIPADGADETVCLFPERERLLDRLKRMAFSRLRGRWIRDDQVAAALVSGKQPKALSRIVKALRETAGASEGFGPLALEFFLTGRAMKARMGLGSWVGNAPGGWSRFLELIGSRTAASGDDKGLFTQVEIQNGFSRPRQALDRLSRSVRAWGGLAEPSRVQTVLSATSLAVEIAALRVELRDLVLATIASLPPSEWEKLNSVRPILGQIEPRGGLVLIEPRYGSDQAKVGDFDLDRQSKALFSELVRALSQRALTGRAIFDRITTLGWLTCACVMSGAIDFEMAADEGDKADALRPAFRPLAEPAVSMPLRMLISTLTALAPPDQADPDAWPWEIAFSIDIGELLRQIAKGRAALASITEAFGFELSADQPPLRMLTRGDSDVEFITADGMTYHFPWWRCSVTALMGERQDRAETFSIGDRLVHPYSALLDSERRVLILQVLSEELATVSGVGVDDGRSSSHLSPEPLLPAQKISAPPTPKPQIEVDHTSPTENEPSIRALRPADSTDQLSGMTSWRERQRASWRARGRGVGVADTGYARIAILQYGFEETYSALTVPTYLREGKRLNIPCVLNGVVQMKISFEEHRRRRVLEEVLECCHHFGVEILVLPEYAARPETINWLQGLCDSQSYAISIWAGTFRQEHDFELALNSAKTRYVPSAPGSNPVNIKPMDAVLSVLFRERQVGKPFDVKPVGRVTDENAINSLEMDGQLILRAKKYPSVGMYEEFRPSKAPLKPLMERSRSLNRAVSFVTELICSELFVFNGPLNWHNFAQHLEKSSNRYNISATFKDWIDCIIEDAEHAALVFSGGASHKPRRSILLLPCATSRDADYHYFAQSAYLASGVVTAFCNAPAPVAQGGSCFIGLGGWETDGSAAVVPGPYHGALPGILTSAKTLGGPLGRVENALVIADIRPDRTVEDKPRSQTRPTPLNLVAHIPIIEAQVCHGLPTHWDRTWWAKRETPWLDAATSTCDLGVEDGRKLALNGLRHSNGIELLEFIKKADALVGRLLEDGGGSTLHMSHAARRSVIAFALSLAHLFDNSPGMRLRASNIDKGMLNFPEPMPSPALCDWLCVDLDIEGFDRRLVGLTEIEATQLEASALPAALREGPWGWCAAPVSTVNITDVSA